MASCSPFGKVDDMVQVPAQRVDILLLLFQTQLMVLGQSLGVNVCINSQEKKQANCHRSDFEKSLNYAD